MANFKSNSFSNLFKLGRKKRTYDESSVGDATEPESQNGPHSISSVVEMNSLKSNSSNRRNKRRKRMQSSSDFDETEENSNTSSEVDDTHSGESSSDVETVEEQKHAEFLEHEKEYDALLPEKYRKYRPSGFKFNLPNEDSEKPIRVYADGIFDLFHIGHMKQLEQCKKAFKNVELVVGVPSDKVTHKLKGLTVLTDKQRCESLHHCKWVDEVIPDCPWVVTPQFLEEHDIDYVAHDDIPYGSADSDDIYKPIKEAGKFLVTQRTDGISTSDIITTIIRDYDNYLIRNFARGATRQELNVSWFKQNELTVKQLVTKLLKKRRHFRRGSVGKKDAIKAKQKNTTEKKKKKKKKYSSSNSNTSNDEEEFEEAEQTPEPESSTTPAGEKRHSDEFKEFARKFTGEHH
ncbi:hypothetical protein ACO0QE_000396 [Hanseniaspora vineae]